jgi:WD40 repeat protein
MTIQANTKNNRARKAWMKGGAALAIALSGIATAGPTGAEGDIYIIGSWANNGFTAPQVAQFDGPTGDFVTRFAFRNAGQFNGMTWGPNGNLYASHQLNVGRWRVAEFDGTTGVFIQNVINIQNAGFSVAKGLAFGPDGDLFVGDFFRGRVARYDGTTFQEIAATPDGSIGTPSGMHITSNGNLMVLSGGNNLIREYSISDGGLIPVGVFNDLPGVIQPQDFTWGPNGNIFVTAGSAGGVLEIDSTDGTFIDYFTPQGNSLPTNGLAFDEFGRFLVSIVFPVSQINEYDAATGALTGLFIDDTDLGIPTLISIKQGDAPSACSAADLAEPFGQLNFFDVSEFLALFSAGDAGADLTGDGQFNFFDVSAFLSVFSAGCP